MVKLWTFRQADIRMTILRLFEVYLKAIVLGQGGTEVLSQIIIPEILAGLQDADPKIYMASLSGLATAIPYALLVTTYVETDVKIKFSIKSLYEQTLIPQIMAFWISEDSSRESRVELIEVVMGMWCSIYTLGLHNHAAVKDLSATLTLTLVSVMKLSSVQERVDLISRSFTKHSTNSLFCVHGLLKFLPQFLLDDEREVREAAARAISMVAQQAVTLASTSAESTIVDQPDSQTSSESEKQQDGGSSSAATSPSSVHASRIRQYCEKQQSLLPPRRSIFSRSTFASERSFSGLNGSSPSGGGSHSAVGSMIGRTNSMTDISSSRRSSMVSQDSFMISEHGSLRTPGAVTPSITRTESFSGEGPSLKEGSEELQALPNQPHATVQARVHAGQEARSNSFSSSNLASNSHRDQSDSAGIQTNTGLEAAGHEDHSESDTVTVEEELMKALEEAKVQMKLRQQQVHGASQSSLSTTSTPKLEAEAVAPVAKVTTVFKAAAFDWDNGDGDDDDGWGEDNLETIDSSTKPQQTVEDEQERKRKEMEMAEKEEQLRLKRDQKQQEMQAKREARRQQLAEKQLQKKATSIATGGIKKLGVSPAASERGLISPVSPSSTSRSPTTLSSTAGVKSTNTVETVASRLARLPIGQFEEENDGWGMDDGLDMSSALEQPTTKPDEDDDLFKDLEVAYKAPTYVKAGASDLGENGNSVRSTPLLGSNASATTLTTDNSSRKDIDNFAKSASQKSVLAVKETATITTGTSLLSSSLTSVTSPAVVSPVSSPGTLPSPRDHSSRNSSQKSSPVSTPLRVASPAPGSVGKGKLSVTSSTSTTTVSETTTITETTTKTSATLREASKSIAPPPSLSTASVSLEPKVTTTPSIALSVDEAALEDDGWGDEWE
ncbi:hypothetical protein BGW38_005726 [Lunasporangiospora selenospora]|uniref:Uncharacterized protein n=1 Tax=Lunasporangiospora selenospora TaxID=979761 RepID=A0A9P6KBA0_9FUNG|nr:hypothetical protein BGW38_005726 [Lunasporangiospora selenospora]